MLPKSWTTCNPNVVKLDIPGPLTWKTADIRIGNTHPVFGNKPWTEQPRGCGMPGNYIYIPTEWLELRELHAIDKGEFLNGNIKD